MAFRTDVSIQWHLSPRIIRVAAPSTDITIQDLHDTLREHEARQENLIYPILISSAGKESLGGGVRVGLTSTLQNAVLAFDARKTSASSGTVTTTNTAGTVLIDSGATFITDLVVPGAWVVNTTDGSVCSVVTVDSETQITTDGLGNGVDNQFQSGDSYKVWNVTQVEVNGGNLVAVDTNGDDIDALLPTAGTQIVRTSSASATLQELTDIQYSSFNGGVTIDVTSDYTGTNYPVGTPRQPVNNLTDALTIANARGFTTVFIIGDLSLATQTFTGIHFIGDSPTRSSVTVDTSANVTDCTFENMYIQGVLDGGSYISKCRVGALSYVNGFVEQCVLEDTVTLAGNGHFLDCWSGIPGATTPIIDFNNTTSSLALRNYNGGITLRNKNQNQAVSIDLNSGQVILESTVSSGAIIIRGVGKLTNNSTGTATVDSTHLLNPTNIATTTWATDVSGQSASTRLASINTIVDTLQDAHVAATTVVQAASTTDYVNTTLTQSDGFFDGMLATVIGAAGACVRTISYYENASGRLHFLTSLPFSPSPSDQVYILSARGSGNGGLR